MAYLDLNWSTNLNVDTWQKMHLLHIVYILCTHCVQGKECIIWSLLRPGDKDLVFSQTINASDNLRSATEHNKFPLD